MSLSPFLSFHYCIYENPKISSTDTFSKSPGQKSALRVVFYSAEHFVEEMCHSCTPLKVKFLGAFAKLRKAAISFVMSVRPSVRPSVRMEQLGSHWTDFHEI